MEHRYAVTGLTCAACVTRVEQALQSVAGVAAASVNLATREAVVRHGGNAPDRGALVRAVSLAGYGLRELPGTVAARAAQDARDALTERVERRRAAVAIVLALPVFVIGMGGIRFPGSNLVQCVLTLAVLAGPGRSFFVHAGRALRRRTADMNTLIALGTSAAFLGSLPGTFVPEHAAAASHGHLYYEAAAVITALVLVGRRIEARARLRAGRALEQLLGLEARAAHVVRGPEGGTVDVPADAVLPGQIVEVRPGERLPVDGVVIEGAVAVDESMITGESMPVAKSVGSAVSAGTVAGAGVMRVRAERTGPDTRLRRIVRLVEEAQGRKAPIARLADRVSAWFVPAVLAIAVLSAACWCVFGPEEALSTFVAVLVIACPCALGLATPTALAVGLARGARDGILVRSGEALEALSQVDVVALDKTGTLTEGKPALVDVRPAEGVSRENLLRWAGSAERASEHPLASAVVRATEDAGIVLLDASAFRALPGRGIECRIDGRWVATGSFALMKEIGAASAAAESAAAAMDAAGVTPVFVAVERRYAGALALSDVLRPTAREAVTALRALGVRVLLLSGDRPGPVARVADAAGIQEAAAGMSPEQKLERIAELRRAGHRVAMAGDGINDAPALAAAQVGIAVATGTDAAVEASDVALMRADPLGIPRALALARRTLRTVKQNLFFAMAYNVLGIPFAAGAFHPLLGWRLHPVIAGAAMALSSISVVLNSLRLKRAR